MRNDDWEYDSAASVPRGKRRFVLYIVAPLVLLGLLPVIMNQFTMEREELPSVVIRIDDIQDFAFRDAQLFLVDESLDNDIPLSLAVITDMFGNDSEIVHNVILALDTGSEVTVHGWRHENLSELSLPEQMALLSQSRRRIKETLDYDATVLVPPMFSFNADTVTAMQAEGYRVLSASSDNAAPGSIQQVTSLPATVELSDFANGVWVMKTLDSIKREVARSVQQYGFAVIVTHPQEFTAEGELDQTKAELYRALLSTLTDNYSFSTLERLSEAP